MVLYDSGAKFTAYESEMVKQGALTSFMFYQLRHDSNK